MTTVMPGQRGTVPPTPAAPPTRARRRHGVSRALQIAGAVVVVLAGSLLYLRSAGLEERVGDLEAERDAAVVQAAGVADPVVELCGGADVTARELDAQGVCDAAEQVQATPVPATVVAEQLTEAELAAIVRPIAAAAVDTYVQQNPAPPGRTPTPDELRSLIVPIVTEVVAAYLVNNPPEPGRDGRDGVDGQTPTADELRALIVPIVTEIVDAALDDYAAANPPPTGLTCPAGESPQVVPYGGLVDSPQGTACVQN